jgi:hypothetical protein
VASGSQSAAIGWRQAVVGNLMLKILMGLSSLLGALIMAMPSVGG